MDLYENCKIIRVEGDTSREKEDILVKEFPLQIVLDGRELVTLVCSPSHLDELAAGYLFSEGIITSCQEIESIDYPDNSLTIMVKTNRRERGSSREMADHIDRNQTDRHITDQTDRFNKNPGERMHRKIITSGCGQSTIFTDLSGSGLKKVRSQLRVEPEIIFSGIKNLYRHSELFRMTGGVHNAMLIDHLTGSEVFRADIGRHNAVDKLTGWLLLNEKEADSQLLLISGRISSEILLKTARAGIPLLISPSAPTDLAVNLAYRLGITLAGFVRGQRMNLYCHRERILI